MLSYMYVFQLPSSQISDTELHNEFQEKILLVADLKNFCTSHYHLILGVFMTDKI